jgi:hypothetical protein
MRPIVQGLAMAIAAITLTRSIPTLPQPMNTSSMRQLLKILPLLLLVGCASQSNQPPAPEIRARIGTAAVEASAEPPRVFIMKPYTRGQAAVATGMEMLAGEELGVLLLPIGVPLGAMFGTPKDEGEAGMAVLLRG